MEARSRKSGNQCYLSTMGKNGPICHTPIQPNTQGIGRYSVLMRMCIYNPLLLAHQNDLLLDTKKNSSFSSKPNSKTGSLVGFWESLAPKGISDKAAKLISNSEEKFQSLLSSRSGASGLAGVVNLLITFKVCSKLFI